MINVVFGNEFIQHRNIGFIDFLVKSGGPVPYFARSNPSRAPLAAGFYSVFGAVSNWVKGQISCLADDRRNGGARWGLECFTDLSLIGSLRAVGTNCGGIAFPRSG